MTAAQQIMMAIPARALGITFVASSFNGGVGAVTVSKPTGTVQGDVMVMACSNTGAPGELVTPSGWYDLYGVAEHGGVCAKVAGDREPVSYVYGNPNSAGSGVVAIVTYRNCIMGAVGAPSGNVGASALDASAITPIANNSLLLAMFAATAASVSCGVPTGMSSVVSRNSPCGLLIASQAVNTGSTGTRTSNLSSGTADIVAGMLSLSPALVPGAFSMWNPLAKAAGAILSGGNLVSTSSGVTQHECTRGLLGISSGKAYWEQQGGAMFGIGTATQLLVNGQYPGNSANSCAYNRANGAIYVNGSILTKLATSTGFDVIGMALDATAKTITWYKNNTLFYTYTYSFTGTIYPISTVYWSASTPLTANFGQSLTYSPPAGYPAGFIY